jgi:hydroxypyruvate isomerase
MTASLCLEMIFRDVPFSERIALAAQCGYTAFEFWDWRNKDLEAVREAARANGMRVMAFSGNRLHTLANPADRAGLIEELKTTLDVAASLEAVNLMLLTDCLVPGGRVVPLPEGLSEQDKYESTAEGLAAASKLAAGAGVTCCLEPLNTKLDHPGYWLNDSARAIGLVRASSVRLLYDVYHMAMMGEDILQVIRENMEEIGHIHVADMPGRHQPGTGTIDYTGLAALLRDKGYDRGVGMEFSPEGEDHPAAEIAQRIFS